MSALGGNLREWVVVPINTGTAVSVAHHNTLLDVTATGSPVDIALPSAASTPSGFIVRIRRNPASDSNVTVSGGATATLTSSDANREFQCDGVAWVQWSAGSAGVTDHGALTGLSDDDHPQYAKAATTLTTTEGIQGGGDLSANRTLKLNVNALTEDTAPSIDFDFVATYDTSAAVHKKVRMSNLPLPLDTSAWPMRFPFIMSNPPTITAGTAGASSAISGSVLKVAWEPGAFTFLGGPIHRPLGYPDLDAVRIGGYPQITSPSPAAIEFVFVTTDSTGRFEIRLKGAGYSYRVLLRMSDGSWAAFSEAEFRQLPNDGNLYNELVTLGQQGEYTVRIEFANGVPVFYGVYATSSSIIKATPRRRRRYIIAGDSFTEPTIDDPFGGDLYPWVGYPQRLAYLTGYDIWSAGSGGTGYVAVNSGLSRPKLRDRLEDDILAFDASVIFAMGINDLGQTFSTVESEIDACFAMAAAANREIIALGPFWVGGITGYPANLLRIEDAIRDAAATYKAVFIPMLDSGPPDFLLPDANWSSTLQGAITDGDSSFLVSTIPTFFQQSGAGLSDWHVRIGSGASQEIIKITNLFADGANWRLVVAGQLRFSAASGQPVVLAGPGYLSGTGYVGNTKGDGIADICTGSDSTHPTMVGHNNIARYIAQQLAKAYSLNKGSANYA